MGLSLRSVLIGSENPASLAEFYGKIFGEPVWSGGDFQAWEAGDGFVTVGPHNEVKGANTSPGRILLNLETEDVEGEFERIKGLGATVVQAPYHPGEEPKALLATFADPDNNYFQLASPMTFET